MSRILVAACLLSLALPAEASAGPEAPRLEATLRIEPVGLPATKRAGLKELTYAFGKKSAPTQARDQLLIALADRLLFEKVVGEGPADYALRLSVTQASSSTEDFGNWQSRPSSLEVRADVAYEWTDSTGAVLSTGSVNSVAEVDVLGPAPRRPDAARAWSLVLDRAAMEAFTEAYGATIFGNEPPPPGGWISAGAER